MKDESDSCVLMGAGRNKIGTKLFIDHFHKWRPLLHSFVFMLITPTALVLKQIFF